MMRKLLPAVFILMLLFSSAHADIYSNLSPGLVSVVSKETIPLRTEPYFSLQPALNLGPGLSVTLLSLDEKTGWAYVRLDWAFDDSPQQGYVRSGALMNGDYLYWDMCRVVNPEPEHRLHLRSAPDANAPSLGKYYTGVLAQNYHQGENGYLRVSLGKMVGYMDQQYLVAYDSTDVSRIPMTVIANASGSGANMRLSPSPDGELFALYPNGTVVAMLGVTPNDWCHVMINGATGFIMADKLAGSFSFSESGGE